jgi:hypothetical protein
MQTPSYSIRCCAKNGKDFAPRDGKYSALWDGKNSGLWDGKIEEYKRNGKITDYSKEIVDQYKGLEK